MRRLFFVLLFIATYARLCDAVDSPATDDPHVITGQIENESITEGDQTVTEQTIITQPPAPLTSGSPAPSAPPAKVYKWVDENGLTHYGDEPPSKDVAPIDLPNLHIMNNDDLGNITTSAPRQPASDQTTSDPVATSSDYQITISAPQNNESIMQNADGIVVVTLSLNTPLLEHHRISLTVDGNETATGNAGTVNLALDLGNHSAQALIMDDADNVLARSEEINFIVTANNNYSVHYVGDRKHHRPKPTEISPSLIPTTAPTSSPAPKPSKRPKPTKAPKPVPEEFNTTPKPVPYTSG